MATSTSKQIVQYGAVMAGAVAIPAIAKGVSAATSAYNTSITSSAFSGVDGTAAALNSTAASSAVDAGTSAFTSAFTDMVKSPTFLTSVGLGIAGIVLGSGSKRPSLSLPNLAATAAVGISVTSLLAKGKAAAAASAGKPGETVVKAVQFKAAPVSDVGGEITMRRSATQTATYKYPLNANDKYWMQFSIRPYARMTVNQDPASINTNYTTIIKLPLPASLMDAIKLAYTDVGLGMFGGVALEKMGKSIEALENTKGSFATKLGAATKEGRAAFKDMVNDPSFMYSIARRGLHGFGEVGQAADILTGTTPNPHMAVTFNGVNLKKHAFSWRFSPDSLAESKQLQYIIRELQRAALPGYETKNKYLFTFPDVVTVDISPTNLMAFKPCAIDSVAVNYAPNGVPSFFANPEGTDRYPTEVEFTIMLRELEVHDKDMPFYDVGNVVTTGTPQSTQPAPTTAESTTPSNE